MGKRQAGTILCQTVGCTVVYATARGNQPLRSPQIILLYIDWDYARWIPAEMHESGGYRTMRTQAMAGGEPAKTAKEIPVLQDSKEAEATRSCCHQQ